MKKIIDKRTIIFLIGYFSLIFGFILNEDMSGDLSMITEYYTKI